MDIKIDLSKFKVEKPSTLFKDEYAWKKRLCPECGRRLYEMTSKPLQYCKNKKHPSKVYPRVNLSTPPLLHDCTRRI
jgi:hypothetical protein